MDNATLLSVSALRRSRRRPPETMVFSLSLPDRGEVLGPISRVRVGGLIGGVLMGSNIGFDVRVSVSPTAVDLGKPERVTMSPVCATGGTRSVRVTQNTYNNNTNYIVKRISIVTTINIL